MRSSEKCHPNYDNGGGILDKNGDGTADEALPISAEGAGIFDKSKSNTQQTAADSTKNAEIAQQTTARRASFSEAKAGEGQCRKRSNEPIKRKSHEKQHRKSTGDEIIEQRLAALAKENTALKSQLEEQIRLNSVIVANPSLASMGANPNLPRIVFANGSAETQSPSFGNIMPNLVPQFSNDEPPPFCALQKSERSAFSVIRPGTNATPQQPPGTPQQNAEHADIHAFNPSTFVHPQQNSEFARLAAQLAPFSLFPYHSLGALFSPPSLPSSQQAATVFRTTATVTADEQRNTVKGEGQNDNSSRSEGNSAPNELMTTQQQQQCQYQNQNQFVQMHSNRSSFPNLSIFANLSSDIPPESKTFVAAASVSDVHSTSDECPLDFSRKSGQQQHQQEHHQHSASSTVASAAGIRPKSVIISASHGDTVTTTVAHSNLAPAPHRVGQMLSKREGQAKQQQQATTTGNNNTISKMPKRSPSSDGPAPKTGAEVRPNGGHWTPVIQQHKHGPPPPFAPLISANAIASSAADNAKHLANGRKWKGTAAEEAKVSSSSSSSSSSSHHYFPPLPVPPPPLPLLLPSHHHVFHHSSVPPPPPLPSVPDFSTTPLLQLLMLRSRIGAIDHQHENLVPPPMDQQLEQPKFADSTTSNGPPNQAQILDTDSSSSSNNNSGQQQHNAENCSSSMLGSLLAIPPNDCRTSPTVPASRTEFCSGLALSSSKKSAQNEKQQQQQQMAQNLENPPKSLDFSTSSTTSNIDKSFSNLNSDSEQSSSSGGQNSPNSAHTSHSQYFTSESPPSTLPGAGSTVTTVCGSDRTRRGSSSPTSGCSGDDSVSMLAARDKNGGGAGNGRRMGDDQIIVGNRRPTHSHSSPPAATASTATPTRAKLRNNDELERYMDRRRRNNEAAKRCRANRRAVFEYRSRKAQLLETENGELRQEMVKLNAELEQLKALIAAKAAARFSMST